VNYVDMYGIFLVNCDLGLLFLPEEAGSLLPKISVLCWVFFWQRQQFL